MAEVIHGKFHPGPPDATAQREPLEGRVDELLGVLGPALMSSILNVEVRSLAHWCSGQALTTCCVTRVRELDAVFHLMSQGKGQDEVRAWFVTPNPHLADRMPAETLRAGQGRAAMGAACADSKIVGDIRSSRSEPHK